MIGPVKVDPSVGTTGTGFLVASSTVLVSRILMLQDPAAVAEAVEMWATRPRCPSLSAGQASYPQPGRRARRSCSHARPPLASGLPTPGAGAEGCTTRLENAHGTVFRELLYRW